MRLKLIFDSKAIEKRFSTGWGLSLLIDNYFLFDTGESGKYILNNFKNMDLKLKDIKKIFISHEHWDHIGGLWDILKENPVDVYITKSFSYSFKERINSYNANYIEIKKFKEIEKDIFTTGEIEGVFGGLSIIEQSLIIKRPDGLVILTGCAHPGIDKIVKLLKKEMEDEISLVIGGFHLMGLKKSLIESVIKNMKDLKVKRVAPLHCVGNVAKELFEKEYGESFIDFKVGESINI